jgi:NADPH-dependent 2,4-dienoyl-CoA reductase/sulfur reductase-like enzyme/nitrite reductase/ring-hydroxylating ferredoxin subunit
MSKGDAQDDTPDLVEGVATSAVPFDGVFLGRVGDDRVILARLEGEIVAVSADCTHYQGPLEDGLRIGDTVRCPWHHACFSLRTGAALEAPALSPLTRWEVEIDGDRVSVRRQCAPAAPMQSRPREPKASDPNTPKSIVIVGGGAAGFAAAQRLRDLGYGGALTLISDDAFAPYDRPNLSKDYLSGEAEADWMPLKDDAFYKDANIDLRLGVQATGLDTKANRLTLRGGETVAYDRLLLATGAGPNRVDPPGLDGSRLHLLRTQADADALIAAAKDAKTVAIIGASFIGLEVAAALRKRGLEVHVIAPDALPLSSKLGPELGAFIKRLHEREGVVFHLQRKAKSFESGRLTLDDGEVVGAELVVAGVGVTPRLDLAEAAGLAIDKGVVVDARFRTSAPGVFAAGDIARYPDCVSGRPVRVEHWVAAERQGQVAAANMLGIDTPFQEPPFFWTAFYGLGLHYVGHAESWDSLDIEGDLETQAAVLRYIGDGAVKAVVTVGPEQATLEAAQAFRDRCRASKPS